MGTSSGQSPTPHPPRSWNWVSNETFAALPFYRRAWEILKQDWLVFVWKLIVDFIGRFATGFVAVLIVVLFVIDFQLFIADQSPLAWIDRAADLLYSPQFIAGSVGALFFASLVSTAFQALVVGGIWGILDRGLRDEPVRLLADFIVEAVDRFPEVLGLFLLRFAVGLITTFLGLAILFGVAHGLSTGAMADVPGAALTFLLAGALTFYLAWAALSRLVVEVMGAPLILDGADLGESILRGAHFVLDNFWSLYRLLVFALGVFLIPLGVYFVFIMVNNFAILFAPALTPVGSILRFTGEVILWTSVSVITVFFYGAVFAFYHCDDDEFERHPPIEPDDGDFDGDDEPDESGSFREGADLDDFIPDEAPHRFDVEDVLAEPEPEPDSREPEPDAGGREPDPESESK